MTNQIQDHIEDLLTKLISFRTLSRDHTANREALEWIGYQLIGLPLHVQLLEFGGFPALIATTKSTKQPKLWLQAHLDVVPASEQAFTAKIENGLVHGRGAFDMKFAIASYILLLQKLGPKLKNYDLGLMVTTDEEVGGEHGVKALIDQGYTSDVVLLPDGGNNWHFVSASRGIWHFELTAKGSSHHGSRPWLGNNAVLALMAFINELSQLFPTEPCNVPYHFHNSMNVGTFNAGKAINQIPDHATAGIDVRYLVEDGPKIKNQINTLVKKHPYILLKTVAEGSGYHVDKDNPYFQSYLTALKKHGVKYDFDVTYGSSDARFFTAIGIPVIVIRPDGGGLHSEDEFISLPELTRFHQVLTDFVQIAVAPSR